MYIKSVLVVCEAHLDTTHTGGEIGILLIRHPAIQCQAWFAFDFLNGKTSNQLRD